MEFLKYPYINYWPHPNEQMDRQEEQIAHALQIITPANLHKAALWRRFPLKSTNSPPTQR
jgi:hypothetical protein